jgi:Ni/Co efflux regulator RcnB
LNVQVAIRGKADRGARVDWRAHRLRHPPRGYEWRDVDGNCVLAAAATGIIASLIANNH